MTGQPDSNAHQAAIDLCRRIVDGQFVAGQRITEREVATLYGVSAAMSREIFHLLEKLGAVTQSARRGARIVDAHRAPPDEVEATWNLLADFLLAEVRRVTGDAPPIGRRMGPGIRPTMRVDAIERRVERLAELARNARIVDLMSRAAMHLAIVAPDRLPDAEGRLCP